jgi:alkylation response protein AidB-like acyl-CoA dehydrogenase
MAYIKLTEKQERLRQEVQEFIGKELTPEVAEEFNPVDITPVFSNEATGKFMKKLGQKNWVLPWLPKEWGGIGASHLDTFILNQQLLSQGAIAPQQLAYCGAGFAAPGIDRLCNEEQKEEYLPKIARAEIEFCAGFTEPGAGTDLASLQMQAIEDGDDFIINGQKVYQTHAHTADYHWLLARTDPSSRRHKGCSLIIVDLKSPGITISPMWCMAGERTNEVFYDNVRVPRKNLVGEKGRGFQYVMQSIQYERSLASGGLLWLLNTIVDFAQRTGIAKDPIVQSKLAQMAIEVEVATLLDYKVVCLFDEGDLPTYEISQQKIFVSECYHRSSSVGLQIMGHFGLTARDSEWASLSQRFQRWYQRSLPTQIGGGTNDMLRSYSVTRGLGLPSAW